MAFRPAAFPAATVQVLRVAKHCDAATCSSLLVGWQCHNPSCYPIEKNRGTVREYVTRMLQVRTGTLATPASPNNRWYFSISSRGPNAF